ncbi:hypothetical protein GRX01_05910 [Halobaculum sp. WSA2]|uniref:Halobacterial output domain-containing protein n=1 Tax=Halobaculum saliterrae TaxID=2073113 RepID=A0A6B0SQA7_9EURY|nr:HalOD1 output domain-containing protein [Halobaculum saliterrae]MXR40875.1 hypothetical protein [Halobaculum saliterrae]
MRRTPLLEDARTDATGATDPTPADEPSADAIVDDSPISAVVGAVAAVDDVDPLKLNATLQRAVDADALASLARHDGTDWRLEFPVGDHEVAVEGDGTVVVDGRVFPNRF